MHFSLTALAKNVAETPRLSLIQLDTQQTAKLESQSKDLSSGVLKNRIFKPVLLSSKTDPSNALKNEDLQAAVGGWGSSGGGSGIACFKNVAASIAAAVFIKNNQSLTPELMAQIESVKTLEYWEWEQDPTFKLASLQAQNLADAILEIHKRIAYLVPLFAYRLEQSGDLIQFTNWKHDDKLPRILDAKPAFSIPSLCQQIQIAARYTKENFESPNGPSKKIPKVRVDVNIELFNKMDLLNQTFLVLHEQIYLLGQSLGHKNSDDIRILVTEFFSEGYDKASPVSKLRYFLKEKLIATLGDYVNYFGEDLTPNGEPFTQEARLKSFYIMLNQFRDQIKRCRKGLLPPEEMLRPRFSNPSCADLAMSPNYYNRWMTEEMAFLFIVAYQFDVYNRAVNSEYLMSPFNDEHSLQIANNLINASCGFIKKYEGKSQDPLVEQKALRYCEQVIPRLSPKEKGQN
jgi:hypothetical protein